MPVPKLQILLVEDQDGNIDNWKDKATAHNSDARTKGFAVESWYAKSVREARAVLEAQKIDAVVVDLRLQADDGPQGEPNDHGNALVKHVVASHPVAMAIYSGQGQEADISDCPQVEIFDRAGGLNPVFDWLAKQREMVLQLRGTRTAIERETARIFFRSIWPRWNHWAKDGGEGLRDTLARHVVAHVHDSMLYLGGEKAHPEETYFVPPLKNRLDTGDLIRTDDGNVWIAVSPRCDLANASKVTTVLIACCKDMGEEWRTKPKEQARMAQHGGAAKWHFLPPMRGSDGKDLGPWYVQFGHLAAVPYAEIATELTPRRFASLAPQFVPSLVERFGAYFSRIGTPNLASD